MSDTTAEILTAQATREGLEAHATGFVFPVAFDYAALCGIVSMLQLALRHPGTPEGPAQAAREFIEHVIQRLADEDLVFTAALFELGNDPAHDTPPENPEPLIIITGH